jgi:hypothetical protein
VDSPDLESIDDDAVGGGIPTTHITVTNAKAIDDRPSIDKLEC